MGRRSGAVELHLSTAQIVISSIGVQYIH